jgi:hypothetical protein
MPIIPALRILSQENLKFRVSPGYIARPCLKNKTTTKTKQNTEK